MDWCFHAILHNSNVEATTMQNIIGWMPLHASTRSYVGLVKVWELLRNNHECVNIQDARGMTALQVLEHQQYETNVPQWERGMTLSQFELVLEPHQQDEKYDPQSQWESSIVNRQDSKLVFIKMATYNGTTDMYQRFQAMKRLH
jgi:hypothetical protein